MACVRVLQVRCMHATIMHVWGWGGGSASACPPARRAQVLLARTGTAGPGQARVAARLQSGVRFPSVLSPLAHARMHTRSHACIGIGIRLWDPYSMACVRVLQVRCMQP
jgi:hypothetical protein